MGAIYSDARPAHGAPIANMDPASAAVGYGRAFLDLLDQEAPAVEFERMLLAARVAEAPACLLAELEDIKLVALRIRGELEQRRRREAELAALFETASDLAALHDLDAVLRAIVHRARLLLGTDVAYLTLHDQAAEDTFMRVTSGSVSAYFQHVRLGMGEGLGGLVAQIATPYVTADYLADERFQHTASIDRAVQEEGLVAILGVPLLLGTSVIGVLFAADRRTRTFGPQEVALLSSMAAHAAVAIDGANLLEETRTALAELNAANDLVKEHSVALERAWQAHHRFTELVLAGGQAEEVADAVAAVLGSDVAILDEHDSPVALSGKPLRDSDPALQQALAGARAGRGAVCADTVWAAPATAGSEHLGTLVLRAGPELPETDRLILERAAIVAALLLLLRRSVTEAEHRVRGEVLSDLLSAPHRDTDSLRARALWLGTDLDKPHLVVVVHTGQRNRVRLRPAAAHLAATRGGLAADYEGNTVLLLPGHRAGEMAHEVASALGPVVNRQLTTCAAGPASSPPAIAAAYLQARRCVEALLAIGRHGEAITPDELGFLGMLLSDRKNVPAFIQSVIGALIDYDARKGTDLVRTIDTYLCSGGNLTATRDALHLHINTVTQRLDRITRLLGEDWRLGERGLEIRVAAHLHQLGAASWAADRDQ
ncbi:MAG TPA: GAF domain-containing protein [Streptosporangiaceae bacterium]|nr:GAF domain-containing protein [Streptosporangiaceae bacterium]